MRIFFRLSILLIAVSSCSALSAQTADDSTALSVPSIPSEPAVATAPVTRSAPSTNPDISAIGDFRTFYSTEGPRNIETYFNGLEVQLSSVVDPYASANFLFSFGKDSLGGEYGAGLEVATLTSIDLPYSLQVSLGRFKPHFTKVNTLHPHAFNFTGFPVMIDHYFGEEGLFMEGVSAAVLLPNPWDLYQELTVEVGRSASTPSLAYGASNRLLTIAHLSTFFDLTDNTTLAVGFSGLNGVNALDRPVQMAGADLTVKWKPVQFNTYHSFTWQSEVIASRTDTASSVQFRTYGGYTMFEYQLEHRTFIGARLDYSGLPAVEKADERSASLLLRFQPTEFQVLALEYQRVNRNYAPSFDQVVFRAIFGIGTHAAHAY